MDKNYSAGVIIAIIIIVGAIFLVRSGTNNTPNIDNSAIPTATKSITIELDAQNNSKENGIATIVTTDRGSKVTIDLQNAPATAQPAHIHLGSCPMPGGIKYPLVSLVNGHSETMINATVEQLIAQAPLAINVHRSQTNLNAYVACGDIASTTKASAF